MFAAIVRLDSLTYQQHQRDGWVTSYTLTRLEKANRGLSLDAEYVIMYQPATRSADVNER